ncbi:MAG: PilZ domain-containing protein [Isosphaeraceae bacterium]
MSESSAPRGENHHPAPEPTVNRWHKKRFRVDRGGTSPGAEGSLLRTFSRWEVTESGRPTTSRTTVVTPSPVTERRSEARSQRPECHAWVSWKTFWKLNTRVALVIDMSRGGARIFLDEVPPSGRPFWVFLEVSAEKAVIRAEIREVERLSQGQCAIRVKFHDPCPYSLFETAVCGMAAADPRARIAMPSRTPPSRRLAGHSD